MSDFLNPHLQRPALRWDTAASLPDLESSGNAMPLLVDQNTGRLLVDLPSYSDPSTTNGLLHSIEADIVAVKDDTASIAGLTIPAHDYMDLAYTGSNLTEVIYKQGGGTGTTVATLTLTYDGSNNLVSVAKA